MKKTEFSLSEECITYCTLGHSALLTLADKMLNGSICLQDIKKIENQQTRFQKLCSAAALNVESDILPCLESRCQQFDAFTQLKNSLGTFCRQMEDAKIKIKG